MLGLPWVQGFHEKCRTFSVISFTQILIAVTFESPGLTSGSLRVMAHIPLTVNLRSAAGHSLGGFTAACSAIFFKDILRVTTFESPGLTSFYHSLARQGGSKDYWQTRVVNYLSVPNPINTCQRHLGLMIRVYQQKQDEPLSLGHICRCLVGTGMQALNCWLAAKVLIRAFKSWSPGVMYLAKRFPALQVITLYAVN